MKTISALLLLIPFIYFGQEVKTLQNDREFSYKIFGNIANYFASEKDLLNFFEFKNKDVVAEVGAANWQNVIGLSILTDSIAYFAEDIDATNLHIKGLVKSLPKITKYKPNQTNSFDMTIGKEKETLLTDNLFDKIILCSTFHEFKFMDEMIADLYKKLKPGGKLYILESECLNKEHKNYTAKQTTEILKKHNFALLKKDGKDINGAKGLYRMVFAKK